MSKGREKCTCLPVGKSSSIYSEIHLSTCSIRNKQGIERMWCNNRYLGTEFSKYYPTQYISEMLKKDYDGIRFNSSLMKDGKNVVLFDTVKEDKNYAIMNSSLHIVENIYIEEKEILPIQEIDDSGGKR
jgi:hypothetical protein